MSWHSLDTHKEKAWHTSLMSWFLKSTFWNLRMVIINAGRQICPKLLCHIKCIEYSLGSWRAMPCYRVFPIIWNIFFLFYFPHRYWLFFYSYSTMGKTHKTHLEVAVMLKCCFPGTEPRTLQKQKQWSRKECFLFSTFSGMQVPFI